VIVVTNVPARTLIHGIEAGPTLWLIGVTLFWLAVSVTVFHRGLRRYSSASS
jgi:ABC-2 type transport system permease protein